MSVVSFTQAKEKIEQTKILLKAASLADKLKWSKWRHIESLNRRKS